MLIQLRYKPTRETLALACSITRDAGDVLPCEFEEPSKVALVEVNRGRSQFPFLAVLEEVVTRIFVSGMRRRDFPEGFFREDLLGRGTCVRNARKGVTSDSFVPAVRNAYNEGLYILAGAEAESSES